MSGDTPAISVVIPAFNEESYLPDTLQAVVRSSALLQSRYGAHTEVVVVDNGSADATATVAQSLGARVIDEAEHNIARVRNRGAAVAQGEVLVFLDADTHIPEELLGAIHEVMAAPAYVGGAVDTEYRPRKRVIRAYLDLWRMLGLLAGMAQGAAQFCRRSDFAALGGYDESLFMGEDVDFYFRLRKYARHEGGQVSFIRKLRVVPSSRRFDRWSLWRTLLFTNPLFILALRRARFAWRGWYDGSLR